MQFPKVHLGGTSAKTLIEEYRAATNAVDAAIKAVTAITVHARDYHLQNDSGGLNAFIVAQHEHATRLSRLLTVRDELYKVWENLDEQAEKS